MRKILKIVSPTRTLKTINSILFLLHQLSNWSKMISLCSLINQSIQQNLAIMNSTKEIESKRYERTKTKMIYFRIFLLLLSLLLRGSTISRFLAVSPNSIRECVHPSVGLSIGPSVGWLVCNLFFWGAETKRAKDLCRVCCLVVSV